MRPPTRSQFHHSDIGGPFAAFAPEFRECGKDVNGVTHPGHHLFYLTRHQRWPVLSMLIDAFRKRCKGKPGLLPSSRTRDSSAVARGAKAEA